MKLASDVHSGEGIPKRDAGRTEQVKQCGMTHVSSPVFRADNRRPVLYDLTPFTTTPGTRQGRK